MIDYVQLVNVDRSITNWGSLVIKQIIKTDITIHLLVSVGFVFSPHTQKKNGKKSRSIQKSSVCGAHARYVHGKVLVAENVTFPEKQLFGF